MRILARKASGGAWQQIESVEYGEESHLQDLIVNSPEVIPATEIREGMPAFTFALREYGLPGSGSTDVLLLNEEGDIAVVECKLAANSETKRKVIGQIFEYASFLWNTTYDELDETIRHRTGKSLSGSIRHEGTGDGLDEDRFREKVTTTLNSGAFHLIVAVDRMNDELSRTIDYLNECGNPAFSFHALELHKYRSGDTEVLVPRLYGQIPRTKEREQRRRYRWNEETFMEHVRISVSEDVFERVSSLYRWTQDNADRVQFGTGPHTGSFTFHYLQNGKTVSVFSVYSDGSLTINEEYLQRYIQESELDRFYAELGQLKSFQSLDRNSRFPTLGVSQISAEDLEHFKERVVEVFKPYSTSGYE